MKNYLKTPFLIFFLVMSASYVLAGEQAPFNPAMTAVLGELIIDSSWSERTEDQQDNQYTKIKCMSNVDHAIELLENKLRNPGLLVWKMKQEIDGDLYYHCKSIVFWGTPATTSESTSSYNSNKFIFPFFYYTSKITTVHTSTFGARVYMGCEQRSFEEKVVYSMMRRCENQPTEACFNPQFLEKTTRIGQTKFLRLVDKKQICGFDTETSAVAPALNLQKPTNQDYDYNRNSGY